MRWSSSLLACIASTIGAAVVAAPDAKDEDAPAFSETWEAVDQITLFAQPDFMPLNEYLLIVTTTKPYLLVFNKGCPGLNARHALMQLRYVGSWLHARTDVIEVGMTTCVIDRIYLIDPTDVTALRKRFRNQH